MTEDEIKDCDNCGYFGGCMCDHLDEQGNCLGWEPVECPSDGTTRLHKLESGDSFIVKSEEPVKLGGLYRHYGAIVSQIFYEPKKWWQFWKKKKQIGFQVTWK